MDCAVLDSVQCCGSGGQTTPVDTCCSDGTFAAFAVGHSVFSCYLPNTDLPLLELTSRFLRQDPAAALAIQTGKLGAQPLPDEQTQTLLAAATATGLLIWVLEDAYAASSDSKAVPAPMRLLSEGAGGPSEAVALSSDGLAAVGSNNSIAIWDLEQLQVIFRLEGHQGVITALTFNPDYPNQLISAAEDRTFMVWDLAEGQLLYQSSIFGAAVPACVAVESQRLVLGCADGSVRQYDLALLPTCRELQVLDVSKIMQQIATAAVTAAQAAQPKQQAGPRTITPATGTGIAALRQQVEQLTTLSTGTPQQPNSLAQQEFALSAATEGSGCILSMQFVQRSNYRNSDRSSGGSLYSRQLVDELLTPAPHLLVCTRRGLVLLNLGSGEIEQCYMFGEEAADVYAVLEAAGDTSRSTIGNSNRSSTPIIQLQQPSEQQLQQQQRWVSTFRALAEVDQPAAACCFAWQQQPPAEDQQGGAGLMCCVASGFSSSVTLLQLAPGRQQTGWGGSAASASDASAAATGSGASNPQQHQQLSVFQTRPLPTGSPLLPKGARASSAGSPTKTPAGSNSSSRRSTGSSSDSGTGSSAAAANTSSSGRATWSQPPSSGSNSKHATAGRAAGALPRSGSPSVTQKPKPSSKGQLAEKPVTFHKKIKSSGYGFVQPKMKLGQAKPAPVKVGLQGNKGPQLMAHQLSAQRQYPLDSGPPITPMPEQSLPGDAPIHGGGITQVEFAADGCRLLTGSTDRTARCLWLPLSKHNGAGTTFVAHNGAINSVCWSHDGEYLLTASSDRTARMWSSSLASPLLTFDGLTQPVSSSASSTTSSRSIHKSSSTSSSRTNTAGSGITRSISSKGTGSTASGPANSRGASSTGSSSSGLEFLGDVTAARFFYMDEMVLLATGNKVHMFRYKLVDAPLDDDIQRLKSSGSYSLAATHSSNCQAVLDIAAANSFLSTLLLLACSNRSIELVDAATMQVACTIPDAHARPVQRLVQPAASPFVSHAREIHELFASTAPDGVVKLWDVRSGRCVRSFTGHKHSSSQVPIGAAFSPCMRYLATGSEDKAACIYDLRSTTLLHKLRPPGQADVVADVAFHPYKPQLVVGCMNGRLHWYGDVCHRAQRVGLPGGMADKQKESATEEYDW